MPFVSAAVSWKTSRSPETGLRRMCPERSISVVLLFVEIDVATSRSNNALLREMRRTRVFAAAFPRRAMRLSELAVRLRFCDRLLLRVGLRGSRARSRRPLCVLTQLAHARL